MINRLFLLKPSLCVWHLLLPMTLAVDLNQTPHAFAQSPQTVDQLHIGVALPLTGELARLGKAAKIGIELGKQRLSSRPDSPSFRITFQDTKSSLIHAKQATQALYTYHRAHVVFSGLSSFTARELVEVAKGQKKILISPSMSFTEMQDLYEGAFGLAATEQHEAKALQKHIEDQPGNILVLTSEGDDPKQRLFQALATLNLSEQTRLEKLKLPHQPQQPPSGKTQANPPATKSLSSVLRAKLDSYQSKPLHIVWALSPKAGRQALPELLPWIKKQKNWRWYFPDSLLQQGLYRQLAREDSQLQRVFVVSSYDKEACARFSQGLTSGAKPFATWNHALRRMALQFHDMLTYAVSAYRLANSVRTYPLSKALARTGALKTDCLAAKAFSDTDPVHFPLFVSPLAAL